ncbi:MAG: DNA-processing protein DprA [Anaerolineae bacterium]
MTGQASEAACWLALIYASGLKLARVKSIIAGWCLERGQPLASLFDLPPARLAELDIPASEREQVIATGDHLAEQTAWLAQLEREGTQLITRADPRYPPGLVRWLPPAMQPLLLFCRGDVTLLSHPSAAIIGARHTSGESSTLARQLATLLAEEGLVVVSGLGKGAGQAAFDGALSTGEGRAMAVLPVGINAFSGLPGDAGVVTAALQQRRALFISPFHPQARFSEAQAIARNRLILGLAEAVFVVSALEGGPEKEMADEALRLGKALYVWDTSAEDGSLAGNQALIQAGALPITGMADLLDAIEAVVATALEGMEPGPVPSPPVTSQVREVETEYDTQAILHLLSKTGRVPEALARRLRQG